jgi:hypothetical protein
MRDALQAEVTRLVQGGVSDDELALLESYRALTPGERAALLETLLRTAEPRREAERRQRSAGELRGS